jgi:DnaJ-class molecular chaperone
MAVREKRSDPYQVLGVTKEVDADAVRRAYRKLARQFHPDVNPGDEAAEARFKEISEAYSVLSDEDKRRNYDEFGEISREGSFDAEAARRAREAFGAEFGTDGGAAGAFGGGFEGQTFEFGDLDDLLGRVFRGGGGARRRPVSLRGEDVHANVELDFLEAARGGEHRFNIALAGRSGPQTETVAVRIPAGVGTGGRIRIAGKGAPGIGGGPPGDLWARIQIRPHPFFRREGRALFVDVPITVGEAVRGARIEVPTLDGRATVTVPAGTDGGQKLRLRGKGIPNPAGGPAGDQYVVVQIKVPRNLDEPALEMLDALSEFDPPELRAELLS